MNTRITRIGIAINWSQLRDLMKDYLDERGGGDEPSTATDRAE